MSVLMSGGAPPPTPAAGKAELFVDVTGTPKMIDEIGRIMPLTDDGLRGWNVIINGEFDYIQRGTTPNATQTAARQFQADRWGVTVENASGSLVRVDTAGAPEAGLQSRFYARVGKVTTNGKLTYSQTIESGNCLHLRGRTARLQLKLKTSVARTMRVALLQLTAAGTVDSIPGYVAGAPSGTFISAHGAASVDPTFGTNLAKIAPVLADNCTIASTGLSCAVTTAWQRFGGTFLLPADFKNLVLVIFTDIQLPTADTFSVGEVGIYDGPEIREWVPRQQAQQFANCQRYYQKSFNADTAPVQNGGLAGSKRGAIKIAGAVATSWNGEEIEFAHGMRAAPALTFYNPSAANAFVRNLTLSTDATATAGANIGEGNAHVNCTGLAAWAVGNDAAVQYAADAEL